MLIMGFLQLSPGVFALLMHYATGKYPKKRATELGILYILGAETVATCLFLCCYFVAYALSLGSAEMPVFAWVAAGMMIVLSVASFCFYYRSGGGSRLFIPRRAANSLDRHARKVKSRSDAFILGALAGTYEIVFTLPLCLVVAAEMLNTGGQCFPIQLFAILYILSPAVPLFVVRWSFLRKRNLADIARMRAKDKNFVRLMLGFCYLTIAILIMCLRIKLS